MSLALTRSWRALLAAGALALSTAASAGATSGATTAATARHTVAYYQTQYTNSSYVSPLPLRSIATDVDVAAFHLNSGSNTITLNDDPPSAAKYTQMWSDLASLQASGVRMEAMLGGAAQGSYADLHNNFALFYPLLRDTLRTYHFDGVDLDIEESFSLADTEHLITQLRTDFGSGFTITLTPVASDLSGGSSFSGGFSYATLEKDLGSQISWYNGQFYCGWGDLSSTSSYDSVVAAGFSASRVVAGTVTNPANCAGYVDPAQLTATLKALVTAYPDFAGAAGWEYFNSTDIDGTGPASWYGMVANAMSGGSGGSGPLTNGGFESGSLTGWTATGSATVSSSAAQSGGYGAMVGSTSPSNTSSIAQTFTAPAGSSRLSFSYNVTCPDTVTYDWATATLKDNTANTSTTVLAKTCTSGAGWKTASGPVTAGHSYTLTLTSKDDNYPGDPTYTSYDNVTVS